MEGQSAELDVAGKEAMLHDQQKGAGRFGILFALGLTELV